MQSKNRKIIKIHYIPIDMKLRLDVDLQKNPTIGSLKPLILSRITQKNSAIQKSPDQLTLLDEDSFELDDAQLTQTVSQKTPLRIRDAQVHQSIPPIQNTSAAHPGIPVITQPVPKATNADFFAQLNQAQNTNVKDPDDKDDDDKDDDLQSLMMSPIFEHKQNLNYIEPLKPVFMLNYRMLNLGFNTTTVYNIKIGSKRHDTMLSDIKQEIFRKHGIDNDKFNCSFYDENGLPFTRTVASLPITDATLIGGLEQVPAEDLKECQNALPRLAYVNIIPAHIDAMCYSKLPHDDSVNCNTQIFIMYNSKSNVIRINLDEDTIKVLKQRVYSKTNVPTDKQSLNYGGKLLVDENNLVQLYGVGVNSNITLNIVPSRNETGWGYSSNFSSNNLETATKQTLKGIRQFRSSMYVLSGRLNENQKSRFLAVLRELSDNNAPMVSAVNRLFKKNTLFYTEKIAIQEGMLSLFRKIFQSSKELSLNVLEKTPQRIFQYSRACLAEIVKTAKQPAQMPERWSDVENFTLNDFSCSVSTKQITDIVGLKLDNGKIVLCDRVAVFQKIQSQQKVNGIEKTPIPQSAMIQVPTMKFLLQLYNAIKTGQGSTSGIHIWQPKVPFMPEKADQGVRKFKLPEKQTQVNKIAEKDSLLKILSALDLKGHPQDPSLTRNGEGLLVVYTGRNKNVNKPIDLFDVMKGESSNASADDLAEAIIQGGDDQIKDQVLIKRTPKEAIVVLFDTSSSMNMKFLDTEITRIAIVKQFFQAFAERTMAYDFHHVISLVIFNHVVTEQCGFTQIFNSFIKHVQKTRANGLTHLYDALYQAGERLNTLGNSYPGVLKRIICLSDGEDVGSVRKSQPVARFLQESGITIDSFIVGPNCETLLGITHATGGHSFAPASLDEGIRLFEWETVLRAGVREKKAQPIKPVHTDYDLETLSNLGYHKKPTNIEQPQKLKSDVAQPSKVLRVARQNVPDMAKLSKAAVMRVKRVLRETNSLNTTPHPAFQFFPCQDEICFWRILMRGPEQTPYQGGVFQLYIQFPKQYPQKPPQMRFITPIYHCNINANGRICHSIFDRNYTVDTTVRMIFDCLYGLLMTPDPQDPLDNAIAQEYYTDLQIYRTKARDMTLKQANKSMLEMETTILKGKNSKQSSLQDQEHPEHLLDPLTHELMEDPVMVKTSGKVYDRKIVTMHIQKHGKDPITQQQAAVSDLVPVDSLLKAIEDYKKTVMSQKAWYLQ